MNITPREEIHPLSPPTLHLLVALALRPANGYTLKQQMRIDGGTPITMGNGSLYPALKRLLAAKWINELYKGSDSTTYELTDTGRSILEVELMRLNEAVQLGRHRLRGGYRRTDPALIMEILPD
jgi:DNA-binding PadR family transcriptional regulator